jgi:hypothetical protein
MTPLTDEQVNERIAKAKGWNFQLCGECNHEWWQMPDGGVDYNQSDPPQYTSDWRLAGELLEEVSKTPNWDVSVNWEQVDENDEHNNDYRWIVYFTYWDADPDNFKSYKSVSFDNPQRAICEAWLQWKGIANE